MERNSHTTHSAVNLYYDGKLEVNQITVDIVMLPKCLLSCKSAKPQAGSDLERAHIIIVPLGH